MAETERAYLLIEEFQARSLMPAEDVEALEATYAGFVSKRLLINSSWINGRLAKRYVTPFVDPLPEIVLGWLTEITTLDCYLRRGFNPSAEQDGLTREASDRCRAEVVEAANAKDGLFDLPLRADAADTSGITRAEPLGDAQPDAYEWIDRQAEALATRGYGT